MKRTICFLILISFLSCNQEDKKEAPAAASTFNEETEKTAILKTIENETNSFYKRDYEGWKQSFIQKDYAFQAWSNRDGTFDASVGWPAVDARIGNYIRNNPVNPGESTHPRVERRNMVVKFFSDNVAYLVWDQYNSDKEGKMFTRSKDQRIMEKENGQWKIANVSSYWDYKNKIPVDSLK